MAAYLIVRMNVTDWDQYRRYTEATPDVLAQFDARFIVRGGTTRTLEGPEERDRIVVIEFPSFERALEFFNSKAYQEAKKLREGAATAQIVAVEGTSKAD